MTAKLVAGYFGHSHALIADAVESLGDIFGSIIVWRGLVIAAEPPDEDHPYGHGKAEPLAAAIVSLLLLLGALWIVVSGVVGFEASRPAPAPFTLIVLLGVIVVKESLFRFVLREGESVESSVVQTDAWHHRSDAITSLAAAIGISIALIGGPRFTAADNIAAMVAACVIAWNAWRLLRPALNELMDRAPGRGFVRKVLTTAAAVPGVDQVEKCIVRKMGFEYFVDMHVQVNPEMSVERSHEIAHKVKDRVREEIHTVRDVLVHIEPSGWKPKP